MPLGGPCLPLYIAGNASADPFRFRPTALPVPAPGMIRFRLPPSLFAALVVAGGVALTAAACHGTRQRERAVAQREFALLATQAADALRHRLASHEQLLRGAAALIGADPGITRDQWRAYVNHAQHDDLFTGIQSVGYAPLVRPAEIAGVAEAARRGGAPSFELRPPGDRPLYAPVFYVEPLAGRNLRVLGFDLMSAPGHASALHLARDSGEARLSEGMDLWPGAEADLGQRAARLVLPVYDPDGYVSTVAERQQAVRGYVYAAFRPGELMRGVTPPDVAEQAALSLYEGRLGANGVVLSGPRSDAERRGGDDNPAWQADHELQFGGRLLTLHAVSRPAFESAHDGGRVWLTGLLGTIGTALAAALAWLLARRVETSRRAIGGASARRLRLAQACIDQSSDAFLMTDTVGTVLAVGGRATTLFAADAKRLAGRPLVDWLPGLDGQDIATGLPGGLGTGGASREMLAQRSDGARFPVRVTATALPASQRASANAGRWLWTIVDLTAQRAAEQRADAEAARETALFEHAGTAVIAFDGQGRIRAVNRAAERLLWYSAAELVGLLPYVALHDSRELDERARVLAAELGEPVEPGLQALLAKPRLGLADENDWTWLRKGGSRVPVRLSVLPLAAPAEGYFVIGRDLSEQRRVDEYIRYLALHDALTGLPNRAELQERAESLLLQARREGRRAALLLIDLDRFKLINDSLGHHVGDDILRGIANRLKATVRQDDLVVRMGGDEFAVMLGSLRHDSEAELVASKMVARLSEELQVAGQRLRVTPSIGMALFPADGETLTDLLKAADAAVYAAKHAGRAQMRRFASEMAEASLARFSIEGLLRRALAEKAFRMRYQPIVDTATLEIVGVEALVSWHTPERGTISPADFIPIAEESGLIDQLGEWTLVTACREIQSLRSALGRDIHVAVNVSPLQLRQADFPDLVARCLQETGLPAHNLTIEVTEGILLEGGEATIQMFRRLRQVGAGLSIDDFGTGYSSLAYLTRLPIDKLKIDKSFVDGVAEDVTDGAGDGPGNEADDAATDTSPRDRAVVGAIITLGRALHLQVVAEGVETGAQFDFLREQGCEAVQGYLFCKPIELTALRAVLEAGFEHPLALPADCQGN